MITFRSVRCPICGAVKETAGNWYFICCGIGHNISEHTIKEHIGNIKNNNSETILELDDE